MTVWKVFNATYQWGGDNDLLLALTNGDDGEPPADVLIGVEGRTADNRPLPVARILGPGWQVAQDTTSGAKAGSVIAVRNRSGIKVRWSLGQLMSRRGRSVQDRYRRVAALDGLPVATRVAGIHNPLPKTGKQDEAVESTLRWVNRQRRRRRMQKRLRWAVAGDFNLNHNAMRTDLDMPHSFGADVMGFIYSEGWGELRFSANKYDGTDHAVLTIISKEKA